MMRGALRAAAALLVASLAPGLQRRLGRPAKRSRRDAVLKDAFETLSMRGVDGEDWAIILNDLMGEETKLKFQMVWWEEMSWHEPFVHMPFTPLINCEPQFSVLLSRFDWKVVPTGPFQDPTHAGGCRPVYNRPWAIDVEKDDPRTVWATAHAIPRLLELAEARLDTRRKDRVVVFSGMELPMSRELGATAAERNATLAKLRRYFGRIVFSVKDMAAESVFTAPMGFTFGYFLQQLAVMQRKSGMVRWRLAPMLLDFGDFFETLSVSNKTKSVLAVGAPVNAWLEQSDLEDRIKNQGRTMSPCDSSLEVVSDAGKSRRQLRAWANTTAAPELGLDVRMIPWEHWWREIAAYRFLLCPLGTAIQTSKTVEALMVLAVPVKHKMGYSLFDDIVGLGFPIVLVDRWDEVTPAAIDRWWKTMSPRLESFRRNCLHVDGFWRMFIGETTRCE